MAWQLSAEGHALSEAMEKALFQALGEVLSDPKYGFTGMANFVGTTVSGNPTNPVDIEASQTLTANANDSTLPAGLQALVPAADEAGAEAGLVAKGSEYPATTATATAEPAAEAAPAAAAAPTKKAAAANMKGTGSSS